MNNREDCADFNTVDFGKYIEDAKRTESPIQEAVFEIHTLREVLRLAMAANNLVDMIRKNIFYGKPIKDEAWQQELDNAFDAQMELDNGIPAIPPKALKIDPRLIHGIFGKFNESGELVEALFAAIFKGKAFDRVNALEELGDDAWFTAILVNALDGQFGKILATNIAKLKARYPEKFTNQNANERDLNTERKILEDAA